MEHLHLRMYSKQDASKLRQEFWTSFGQYLSPVLSSEGEKINWMNYKTGEKNLVFRMQADNRSAKISIDLTHKDAGIRELYFEQLLQLKKILHLFLEEDWEWVSDTKDETGKSTSSIYKTFSPVNIFSKTDWPALISFFKPRLIALDAFWNEVKYGFEALH